MKIMEGNYLLPHSWRKYGWVMLAITIALSIVILLSGYEIRWPNTTVFAIYDDELMGKDVWFSFIQTEIGDELVSIGLIISALIVAFTKEKIEDEFISSIRLKSLVWATYINHAILLLSIMFVFGMGFLNIMIFNMFTLLLFFIIKYQWSIYQWNKGLQHEE